MSVAENLTATELDHFRRGIFINRRGLRSRARDLIDEFDITAASERAPLSSLSGGNQQRVVIARELSREPRVVVAEEPSRGLDVGAIETMYERLQRVASLGAGVVLIVGDLNELLAIADRIVVVFNGRLFGDFARDEIDLQKLSALVGGHHDG
jgi:simple sugar transport system ATP-binding protein